MSASWATPGSCPRLTGLWAKKEPDLKFGFGGSLGDAGFVSSFSDDFVVSGEDGFSVFSFESFRGSPLGTWPD